MLINQAEYRKMFETEEKLWWYKILHEKVLREIDFEFPNNKNLKILDAGCGTGGMMVSLKNNGFHDIIGFDFSEDAVNFCLDRKLNVKKIDITKFDHEFENSYFDIIINNDVLYQFDDEKMSSAIFNLEKKLKPNGILISNNQAFNIFYGTHDIAVGAKRRFRIGDFEKSVKSTNLEVKKYTYWSLFLAPIILAVRIFQQFQLKFKLINIKEIKSDVEIPSDLINNLFYNLLKLEEKLIKKSIFGSSLFIVFFKKP